MKQNDKIKGITLNNARGIIRNFETKSQSFDVKPFTMTQDDVYNINITDKNIINNSQFIADLWD